MLLSCKTNYDIDGVDDQENADGDIKAAAGGDDDDNDGDIYLAIRTMT